MPKTRLDKLRIIKARRNLLDFACYIDPGQAENYQAKHLAYVASQLDKVMTGDIKRLMIFMPNRHWKSSLATMKFPAYFIGKRFEAGLPHQTMIISHTIEKAKEFSGYVRDLVQGPDNLSDSRYHDVFPNVRISSTYQSAEKWGLKDAHGREETFLTMHTGGITSPPTGGGADLLLVDDVIKKPEDARSKRIQKIHFDNWTIGITSRLNNPNVPIVFTMTRFDVGDLPGRLLAKAQEDALADQWHVVLLPALAYTRREREMARKAGMPVNDEDPIGRNPGEALWPVKFPITHHEKVRANSPRAFASIGQQLPIPEGGNLVDPAWFRSLKVAPQNNVKWIIAIDGALKEKQIAKDDPDFIAMGLVGWWTPADDSEGNLVLAALVRTQAGLNNGKEAIGRFAEAMRDLLGYRVQIVGGSDNVDKVFVMGLQGFRALQGWSIRSLGDRTLRHQAEGFKGDKVARADVWMSRAEGGRFYLVDEAWSCSSLLRHFGKDRARLLGNEPLAWHQKFKDSCEAFPHGPYDDMEDMISVGAHGVGVAKRRRKAERKALPVGWFA